MTCREERKQLIADFSAGLVTALEQFLLAFCARRQLGATWLDLLELMEREVEGTNYLIQAVTTQMSCPDRP